MVALDRFRPPDADPPTKRVATCAYCDDDVYDGDYVCETYDGEIVHDDCWRDWCAEMYRAWRGVINERGEIC